MDKNTMEEDRADVDVGNNICVHTENNDEVGVVSNLGVHMQTKMDSNKMEKDRVHLHVEKNIDIDMANIVDANVENSVTSNDYNFESQPPSWSDSCNFSSDRSFSSPCILSRSSVHSTISKYREGTAPTGRSSVSSTKDGKENADKLGDDDGPIVPSRTNSSSSPCISSRTSVRSKISKYREGTTPTGRRSSVSSTKDGKEIADKLGNDDEPIFPSRKNSSSFLCISSHSSVRSKISKYREGTTPTGRSSVSSTKDSKENADNKISKYYEGTAPTGRSSVSSTKDGKENADKLGEDDEPIVPSRKKSFFAPCISSRTSVRSKISKYREGTTPTGRRSSVSSTKDGKENADKLGEDDEPIFPSRKNSSSSPCISSHSSVRSKISKCDGTALTSRISSRTLSTKDYESDVQNGDEMGDNDESVFPSCKNSRSGMETGTSRVFQDNDAQSLIKNRIQDATETNAANEAAINIRTRRINRQPTQPNNPTVSIGAYNNSVEISFDLHVKNNVDAGMKNSADVDAAHGNESFSSGAAPFVAPDNLDLCELSSVTSSLSASMSSLPASTSSLSASTSSLSASTSSLLASTTDSGSSSSSSSSSKNPLVFAINIKQTVLAIRLLFLSPFIFIVVYSMLHDPGIVDNTVKDVIDFFEGDSTFSDNISYQGSAGRNADPLDDEERGVTVLPCPSSNGTEFCCNGIWGSACDLPMNRIMFATALNAAGAPPGLLPPSTGRRSLKDALYAGYRGLTFGLCNCNNVMLALCQSQCDYGSVPPINMLKVVYAFLALHRNEVVVIFLELYECDTLHKFYDLVRDKFEGNLTSIMYDIRTAENGSLPSMRELIEMNRRLIVFEKAPSRCAQQSLPYGIHEAHTYVSETVPSPQIISTDNNNTQNLTVTCGTEGPEHPTNNTFLMLVHRISPSGREARHHLSGDSTSNRSIAVDHPRPAEELKMLSKLCSRQHGRNFGIIAVDYWDTDDVVLFAKSYNDEIL